MPTIEALPPGDGVLKRVQELEATITGLSPNDVHFAFASGRFAPGTDLYARLYVLVDHAFRTLQRTHRQQRGSAIPEPAKTCVTRWWRDPIDGFTDVPDAVAQIASVYVELSGIDPSKLGFLSAAFAGLLAELGEGGPVGAMECRASGVKVNGDAIGEVRQWLLFGNQSRRFATFYLAERRWTPPAPGVSDA